ncbi:hypothetical protein D0Z08_22130 [Nocardioides immobilis]|uniref:Uncharacterized protein n=1 Tax=Nocardioides immobilis TaxID=2049295 RepID=A0A417XWZ9_9ACTN|nr:hypothetical protein [Nocardioides immobilis]RHW24903.1 hypothetical protein D0Z08_22130 [Nocardioides immobilis]
MSHPDPDLSPSGSERASGMTWHSVTVPTEDLHLLVVAIAGGGGTITSSRPCPAGVRVTYVSEHATQSGSD